jgi:predicted transcriptional regulator
MENKAPAEANDPYEAVVDYVMARIYSMQQSNQHLRSRLDFDELTATHDNVSIKINAKTRNFLIGLFPERSIPQKRESKIEGDRTSFKQKYSRDLAEKKRRMLALYLNICWGLASLDEITDEMQTFSRLEPAGPIDFIIRILFICAYRITPAGRRGVTVSDSGQGVYQDDFISEDLNSLLDPELALLSSEDIDLDVWADYIRWLDESDSLKNSSVADERMSPALDSVSSEFILSRLEDHENQLNQLHLITSRLESLTLPPQGPPSTPPSHQVTGHANPELDKFLLGERVLDLLRQRGKMKAHQIARELGEDKPVINQILYKVLEGQVINCGPAEWSLNPCPVSDPLHARIEQFLSENPDSDAQTIARSLNSTPSDINRTLDQMEAQGKVVHSQPTPDTRPTWSLRSKRMRDE